MTKEKTIFKILNLYGKEIGAAKTFKEACDKGMALNIDFMIKEGTRKAEIMDASFRNWYKWWHSPERKIVDIGDGFRLV